MRCYVNAFLLLWLIMPQIKPESQPSWTDWWKYNLGVIKEGSCYRTCQLGEAEFCLIFKEKNITHNVNLRGTPSENEWWYHEWQIEQAANQKHGVVGLDIALHESSIPSLLSLTKMLAAIHTPDLIKQDPSFFETSPEHYLEANNPPQNNNDSKSKLLVHCRRGADRTGLFASLYIIEKGINGIKNSSELHKAKRKKLKKLYQEAVAHLCLYHGHFFFVYPKMREFINIWWEIRKRLSLDESIAIYKNFLADLR